MTRLRTSEIGCVLGLILLSILLMASIGGGISSKLGLGLPYDGISKNRGDLNPPTDQNVGEPCWQDSRKLPTYPFELAHYSTPTWILSGNNRPIPHASSTTLPTTTYRGYVHWHHTDGYAKYNDTTMNIGHDFDFWNEEWRGFTEWNISSIPDDTMITYVGVQLTVNGAPGECDHQSAQVCFYEMANRPSLIGPSAQTLFDDAGNGIQYYYGASYTITASGSTPFIKLGQSAVDALSSARTNDWFAVGFIDFFDGGTESSDDEGLIFSSAVLQVIYYEGGDDVYEENDLLGSVANLVLGTYTNLRCFDVDYFAVTVPRQNYSQYLRVVVTCDASVGELQLDLYDLTSARITNQSSGNELKAEYCVAETENGIYKFAISGVKGEQNIYSLTLELLSECPVVVNPWMVAGIIAGVIGLVAVGGGLVKVWRNKKSHPPLIGKSTAASPSIIPPASPCPPQPVASPSISLQSASTPFQNLIPNPLDASSPQQATEGALMEEAATFGRFCNHCGAELGPTDTFCKRCGLNLS
ncbi:MAG: hypothetical protein RBG13Loki_0350 [Promethearchaeota archaeon CR_4]|nr:MAG: hypothetical protein RBG13Loki_0350 [Candidatus Lokiarchaeota archaeon CR_4]